MSEPVLIPGGRDGRASLDRSSSAADAIVAACPPHPQHGGSRHDTRLVAVRDALIERGIDCLRIDYGPWDEGYGETTDADVAVNWALDRYDDVGLFGYSFGGCIALVTAASQPRLSGVCALAPPATLQSDIDAVAALESIDSHEIPTRIVYGNRDTTAAWKPVVERAESLGLETVSCSADHFFVGQTPTVAAHVADFFEPLRGEPRDVDSQSDANSDDVGDGA